MYMYININIYCHNLFFYGKRIKRPSLFSGFSHGSPGNAHRKVTATRKQVDQEATVHVVLWETMWVI